MSEQLDRAFEALAHPQRRAMLSALASGPTSPSDLAAALALAPHEFLRHAMHLADAGMVTGYLEGDQRLVACAPQALEAITVWLANQGLAQRSRRVPHGSARDVLFGGPATHPAAVRPASLTAA